MPPTEQSAKIPVNRADSLLLIVLGCLAAGCAALAILVSTDWWAAWFTHPAQQRPELTRQGAALWRVMLGVTALMLVIAPMVWRWAAVPRGDQASSAVPQGLPRPRPDLPASGTARGIRRQSRPRGRAWRRLVRSG